MEKARKIPLLFFLVIKFEVLNSPFLGNSLVLLSFKTFFLVFFFFNLVSHPALARRTPRPLPPLKIGVFHPNPRFCMDQEPSQKDVRILRLAFGLKPFQGFGFSLPHFFKRGEKTEGSFSAEVGLVFNPRQVWDRPEPSRASWDLALPEENQPYGLRPWMKLIRKKIPALVPHETKEGVFSWEATPGLSASELGGTELLPFRLDAEGKKPCRSWPKGVDLKKGGGGKTYILSRIKKEPKDFILYAYRSHRALRQAFLNGAVDGMWLEAADVVRLGKSLRALPEDWFWGWAPGGQMIVLEVADETQKRLGLKGQKALSLAINRKNLAPGGFTPATGFLYPLLSQGNVIWNSMAARQNWAGTKLSNMPLRMASLDHPQLARLARGLVAQWAKTLNLEVRLSLFPFQRFSRAVNSEKYDLVLGVKDLNTGSLQSLWEKSLGEEWPEGLEVLKAHQIRMEQFMPFIPLLSNRYFSVTKGEKGKKQMNRLCPECLPLKKIPWGKPLRKKQKRMNQFG